MSEKVYTLAQIREVLNDGLLHCAQSELKRWTKENTITAEAAELETDIESEIKADLAEWDEFLSEME
jgi:hypothetical protein